jgi:hypothetical protein
MSEGSSFKITALIGTYNKEFSDDEPQSHYFVNLMSFGIRKGQELFVPQRVKDGGLTAMVQIMKSLERPTPMTLLWSPPEGQKLLFQHFKPLKLKFEITFGVWGASQQIEAEWVLTLDRARISHLSFDKKQVKDNTFKYQRVDARFKEINFKAK